MSNGFALSLLRNQIYREDQTCIGWNCEDQPHGVLRTPDQLDGLIAPKRKRLRIIIRRVASLLKEDEISTYPGDVLPLWNPEVPGEEIQAGRLGIRVRPQSPAAAKLAFIPDGAEWLREVLEERREIDGYYAPSKLGKPLDFIGQVASTLLTGRLGRTR